MRERSDDVHPPARAPALDLGGITTYQGVPYAAPPVGARRWAPPAPVTRSSTLLRALTPAPECPEPSFGTKIATSENCLYLKIEVPAGTRTGADLPVVYEVHGGGFIGEANPSDGDNFVTHDRAVYVFVQYRLGILGFLAERALGPHSGDYGLQDQQAGLRWVQQNIAQFGGDPHDVTIFGESAGGASVCDQLASPTAQLGALHSGTDGLAHDTATLSPDQTALRTQILAEWGRFAASGNPSATGTPRWTPYSSAPRRVMVLGAADSSQLQSPAVIAGEHDCGFWDRVTHC